MTVTIGRIVAVILAAITVMTASDSTPEADAHRPAAISKPLPDSYRLLPRTARQGEQRPTADGGEPRHPSPSRNPIPVSPPRPRPTTPARP